MNNHLTNKNNNLAGTFLQGVQGIIINSLAYAFAYFFVLIFVLGSAFFTTILPAIITLIILLNTFLIGGLMGGLDKTYWLIIMAVFCIALAYPVFILAKLKCMQAYCALMRGET